MRYGIVKISDEQLERIQWDSAVEAAALQIAPLYRMFGWTWIDEKKGMIVPTFNDIANAIRENIETLFGMGVEECGSGRLSVSRCNNGEGYWTITISLNLADIDFELKES